MATLGPSLGRQVRSELLKLFTTRLWWGMALGVFIGGAAFSTLFAVLYANDLLGQAAGPAARPSATRPRSSTPSTPPGSASATCCC